MIVSSLLCSAHAMKPLDWSSCVRHKGPGAGCPYVPASGVFEQGRVLSTRLVHEVVAFHGGVHDAEVRPASPRQQSVIRERRSDYSHLSVEGVAAPDTHTTAGSVSRGVSACPNALKQSH